MDINEVSYRKDYYEKHKDRIKQQVKSRYLTKKDEINKKIKCEKCGRLIIERMLKKLGDWDVSLPQVLYLEGNRWRREQVDLYDRKYMLTQPEN